jgi:Phage tail tube protein
MALESGLAAQWCAIDETTYGVAPSLSTAKFYACDSDTLGLKKVTKQGTGIYAGALFPKAARRVVTEYSVQGDLVMDLPERYMEQWLYRMFGSYGQTPAALTQDGVTGAYSATHAPGALEGHSFVIQKGVPAVDGGTVDPFTYTGCKVADWEISCAMGEIAKLKLTIEGRNELAGTNKDPLNGSVPATQAFSAPPGSVFRWVGATVYYGGTPSTTSGVTSLASPTVAGHVKGPVSVQCKTPLDLTRYAPDVAPYRNEPLQNGLRSVTGSFVVEWLSAETYYNAFAADTATAIEFQFTTVGIGSGADVATMAIMVPNVRLEGESPKIPGPQVLTQTVGFTGLDDGTNNVVQATYWTLDAS